MQELEFVNREKEMDYIIDSYTNYIIIVAPLGYGKSLLINYVAKELKRKEFYHIDIKIKEDMALEKLKSYFEKETKNIDKSKKLYITLDDINATSKENIEKFINNSVLKLNVKETKVVLTTRKMRNRLKLDRRFIERKITPFDFSVIKEATERYLKKNSKIFNKNDTNLICKLAYNILYHTGGHPKCVSSILQNIVSSGNIIGYFDNKKRTFKIVEEHSKTIIDNLSEEMQKIIPILSPIRKFNAQTLRVLIESGFIEYNIEDVFELEDKLTKTKIIERRDSFLQDNIIRKLLAINLRNKDAQKYLEIITIAKESHRYSIENRLTVFPHLLGIELIFIEIEDRLEKGVIGNIEYINSLFSSTLNLLLNDKPIDKRRAIKAVFIEKLREDVELECIVNFYLSKEKNLFVEVYENLVKRLEDE